tara:strand:+ start:25 stop:783 length:759 start_codon:yes stop_codon:yes gene_type:complete
MDKFENFSENIKYNNETIKNVIMGGKYYTSLTPSSDINKNLESFDKSNKVALIGVLAPWCGYCKRLKDSGELKKIAAKFPVVVMDDKHHQTKNIMNVLGAEGFPALGIYHSGNLVPYNGNRTSVDIMAVMSKLEGSSKAPKKSAKLSGKIGKVEKSVTLKDYSREISKMSKTNKVVTVFLADWCGYCTKLKDSKLLEGLAERGVIVMTSDDKNKLSQEMKISGFPTIYCMRSGKNVIYNGDRSVESIIAFCK